MARDRLAVWTYLDGDEEVACGRPDVTDDERETAGRPSLADLTQQCHDRNRQRAAEHGRSSGLPDGVEFARVWWPRDPAALRRRIGDDDLAVWAEDDVLHLLWRGTATRVDVYGGWQKALWAVEEADDLWEASMRIRDLARYAFSLHIAPHRKGENAFGVPAQTSTQWRGPAAPAPLPEARPLRGCLVTHTLDSAALGGARAVTAYVPPSDGPLPGCVLADGQSVEDFAPVLEQAMVAGQAPPTAIVGIHCAEDLGWPDGRWQEYVPGANRHRFAAHHAFVVDEVLPWAHRDLQIRDEPWTAAGYSNGAVWAIAAAQRRPDLFPRVVALSPGVHPRKVRRRAREAGVRHYLVAGRLEPGFLRATQEWAELLHAAGLDARFERFHGGHDELWWRRHLVAGLAHCR